MIIIWFLAFISSLMLISCGTSADSSTKDLSIDIQLLSEEPSFIDWTQNGTKMQIIAMKDPNGKIRLAFNTCQTCQGSPWAWFEYLGDGVLQCQNCGQLFPTDTVGTESAKGCNPITISEFSESDGTVTVSSHILEEAESIFANWKKTGK